MSNHITLSAERDLPAALEKFKRHAAQVKAEHAAAVKEIKADPRRSDLAKRDDIQALNKSTRTKLDQIKGEQETFVSDLKTKIEQKLRGNQPTDAASVVSRRDASDRARKLDRKEALDVLNGAIAGKDDDFAHAIGNRARNVGWLHVAEAYKAAYASTSDAAEALHYVESNTSGAAYNFANNITFSAPID